MKVNEWDILYEWKVVMLLVFGFGLVGFDCWFIVLLFFLIMKDLNLNVQDVGNCIGVFGLLWGIFVVLMGGILDKIGCWKVLILVIIVFLLLLGFLGFVGGLFGLMVICGLMGVVEGLFCLMSFVVMVDVLYLWWCGLNFGLQ